MLKQYCSLFFPACLLAVAACNDAGRSKPAAIDTAKAAIPVITQDQGSAADTCAQLVYRLVATTSLFHTITTTGDSMHMRISADSLNFFIDNADDNGITVKLSHENEAESGAFVDAVDAWIYIDLHKEQVWDVTIDPDSPVALGFDKALLQQVQQCRLVLQTEQ
jgi:hypothetical protein